jgi:hypothetical protein
MTETERTLKRIEKLLAELLDRLPNVKPKEELPESAGKSGRGIGTTRSDG